MTGRCTGRTGRTVRGCVWGAARLLEERGLATHDHALEDELEALYLRHRSTATGHLDEYLADLWPTADAQTRLDA